MKQIYNKIAIIGATSAIAEHCARLLAENGAEDAHKPAEIWLVGRDQNRLNAIMADLKVRSPQSSIITRVMDFMAEAQIAALVDEMAQNAPVDFALIAHGHLPDQKSCQQDLTAVRAALEVNALSPVFFAEAFAGHMEQQGKGTLVVIGSVAGDRGRKSNYVYGAAKGLVDVYMQGLQHRLAARGVKAVLVKPGPTATPMTAHLQQKGARLAAVEDVAAQIVHDVAIGKRVIYTPKKWWLIMAVVRNLPFALFKKMEI